MTIEQALLATAPSEPEATALRQVLAVWLDEGASDPRELAKRVEAAETLGPISLSYLDTTTTLRSQPAGVGSVRPDAPELLDMLGSVM